jgi:hypothetical protein
MNSARRWYIYLVCAITLQAAAWAAIALLRNLVAGGGGTTAYIALQIAIVIIALPLFLVHWLWAERLVDRDRNELEASLRRTYLYAMSAGFLGPVIANAFTVVDFLLWVITGRPETASIHYQPASTMDVILYHCIAILFCSLLWYYKQMVIKRDAKLAPPADNSARGLYILGFSAWGLTMTTLGIIHIIRWIMWQFGNNAGKIGGGGIDYLTTEVTRLLIGTSLWLLFWRQAQALFTATREEEQSSLRKFYLYTVISVAVLSAVTNTTLILAALFRRLLGLHSGGDIRTPLPIIIGMIVLWAFHAYVLRGDTAQIQQSSRQAGVRRLYLYLIAGIGLAAFLVGLSGDLSVLIRSFSQQFNNVLREQLSWFTAALIAGLPVWLLPWRQAQTNAVATTPDGIDERHSTVRKIYLYFYLFVATMTVLSGAVYVLYRVLALILGERGQGNLLSGIAQAIAYAIVGVGVWLYHGSALRGDQASNRQERATRLKEIHVEIVDVENQSLGRSVMEKLKLEEPELNLEFIALCAGGDGASTSSIPEKLRDAGLIIGPWSIAVDGGAGGIVQSDVARAVVTSPARKILIPTQMAGWDWAGVDHWKDETLVQQTVQAVKQWVDGEEIKAVRPLGIGAIIGIIVGVLILLILVAVPLLIYFGGF